jgi:ribosomal subunit interface protein
MNIQFKTHQLEGLASVEAMIQEKLHRFERMLPDTAYVEIEFKQLPKAQINGDKEVEAIVDIPGQKPVIRFACQGTTFLEAADCVLDKLDQELSREKGKTNNHSLRHQPPLKEQVAEMVNQEEM